MRVGVACAQTGGLADPAAVRATALAAEQVGYSSVWVLDRLPNAGERVLDPFVVLAAAASVTSRIRVGTGVIVAPWYPPAVLARLLTSLDVMSEGRLTVGLGTGGSVDEYRAAGADIDRRREDLTGILDLLDVAWPTPPAAADRPLLRPVQRPRPPLLLAAYTPAALEQVARRADGWMPSGLPVEMLAPLWARVRDTAAGFGRDPDALHLAVRADVELTTRPLPPGERPAYHGRLDQVIGDMEATSRAGADEVILHHTGDPSLDELLATYACVAEGLVAAAPVRGPRGVPPARE